MVSPLHHSSTLSASASATSSSQSRKDERIPISLSQFHKDIRSLPPELQEQIIPRNRDALCLDVLETPARISPMERIRSAWQHAATGNQGSHSQEEASTSRKGLLTNVRNGWRKPSALVEKVFKMVLLANDSKSEKQNYDLYLQESLRHGHQPLFIALLRGSPKPDLSPLIHRVVRDGNENAWAEIVKKVDKALPDNTMHWLAECGEPEKLEQLLQKMPPDAYPDEEKPKTWLSMAQQQATNIKELKAQSSEERRSQLGALMTDLHSTSALLYQRRRVLQTAETENMGPAIQPYRNDVLRSRQALTQKIEKRRLDFLALSRTMHASEKLKDLSVKLLGLAIANNRMDLLKLLLDGRWVNMKDKEFAVHLLHAASSNRSEMVETLANEPDADVNHVFRSGTPLHIAAETGLLNTMATLLKKPGIQVNTPDKKGQTALHLAAKKGNLDVLQKLLGVEGIAINARDKEGLTPLHYAAKENRQPSVFALSDMPGIDLNARDKEGRTPLQSTSDPVIQEFLRQRTEARVDT